jgi:hypothetical protein
MAYTIRANNKDYTVSDHAARRMRERYIPEEMVVEALENGVWVAQPHHTDLYEHEIYDDILDTMIIVRVVVDEKTRTIVSVIDDTESKS